MSGPINDSFHKLIVIKTFSSAGIIGSDSYFVGGELNARVVIEGVDLANSIDIQARIRGASSWTTLETVAGPSLTGSTVDLSTWDEIRLNCTSYVNDGESKIIVSGYMP